MPTNAWAQSRYSPVCVIAPPLCRAAEIAKGPRPADSLSRGLPSRVGDTGFEPVTSSVSRKRATAAPIALAVQFRGGDGIRTRVYGFAGRCLASRPRHPEANLPTGGGASERMTGLEPATLTLAR